MRQFLDKAFRPELREVITERAEAVALHGKPQSGGHVRTNFAGAEGAGRRDLGEAHQGMHQGQLPGLSSLRRFAPLRAASATASRCKLAGPVGGGVILPRSTV